jgi:hypothetical protein
MDGTNSPIEFVSGASPIILLLNPASNSSAKHLGPATRSSCFTRRPSVRSLALIRVHDRLDPLLAEEFKDLRIEPPRRGNHPLHDPREGFRSFWLSLLRPIPGPNKHFSSCHQSSGMQRPKLKPPFLDSTLPHRSILVICSFEHAKSVLGLSGNRTFMDNLP